MLADNVETQIAGNYSVGQYLKGAVCYPFDSHKQRGYILYRWEPGAEYGNKAGVMFNYCHHNHPFSYPYKKVEDMMLTDGGSCRDKTSRATFEFAAEST